MMYYGNGMGGLGVVLMALSNLLFWSLVIAGVVVLVRYLGRGGPRTDSGDATPRRVLAERFARGEIDEEDYVRRLQVLGSAPRVHGTGA